MEEIGLVMEFLRIELAVLEEVSGIPPSSVIVFVSCDEERLDRRAG